MAPINVFFSYKIIVYTGHRVVSCHLLRVIGQRSTKTDSWEIIRLDGVQTGGRKNNGAQIHHESMRYDIPFISLILFRSVSSVIPAASAISA